MAVLTNLQSSADEQSAGLGSATAPLREGRSSSHRAQASEHEVNFVRRLIFGATVEKVGVCRRTTQGHQSTS